MHAGDVRDVWGEPGAYSGAGLPDALALLARITREKGHMPLHADLDDVDEPPPLPKGHGRCPHRLGETSGERTPARFIGDAATLVRLYSGRPLESAGAYELVGVDAGQLNIFG